MKGNLTFSVHLLLLSNILLSVPPNGLVIYCGTIVTDEGKEKKVNIDFEPFRPINTSLYLCDNKFHTEVMSNCKCVIIPLYTHFEEEGLYCFCSVRP